MNEETSIGFDMAQREAALARVRNLLEDDQPIDDPQRETDLRSLLAGLALPFPPASAETVARTVTNVGVALGKGLVPYDLQADVTHMLLDWLEDDRKGIEPIWRSHIALRLANAVYSRHTSPQMSDEIAVRLIAYAARATYEDEMLEHSVEALFMAAWENEALGIEYAHTVCSTVLDHIVSKTLSITMLGRMLHATATTLAQRRVPHGLGNEVVQHIAEALPILRAANSEHYGLLAWTLSDAAARDLAQNVPLELVQELSDDEFIDQAFRDQMKNTLAIAQMMAMLKNMENNDSSFMVTEEPPVDDETLILGLLHPESTT